MSDAIDYDRMLVRVQSLWENDCLPNQELQQQIEDAIRAAKAQAKKFDVLEAMRKRVKDGGM